MVEWFERLRHGAEVAIKPCDDWKTLPFGYFSKGNCTFRRDFIT